MTSEYQNNLPTMSSHIDLSLDKRSGLQAARVASADNSTNSQINKTENDRTELSFSNTHSSQALKQTEDKAENQNRAEKSQESELLSDLKNKLESLNDNKGWGVQFSVDEESDHTVIRVIDAKTKETIRQIPSEELIELNKRVQSLLDDDEQGAQLTGILFNEKA